MSKLKYKPLSHYSRLIKIDYIKSMFPSANPKNSVKTTFKISISQERIATPIVLQMDELPAFIKRLKKINKKHKAGILLDKDLWKEDVCQ